VECLTVRQPYSKTLLHYFFSSRHVGDFSSEEELDQIKTGRAGVEHSGDVVQIQLKIKHKIIEAVRFKAYGSVACIACCAWISECLEGKRLVDVEQLHSEQIMRALELPPTKVHVVLLVIEALRKALND
jgi:nitrogen fixation NifU-like protein